jgi:peptide/nickel transport system substrate-binding protein
MNEARLTRSMLAAVAAAVVGACGGGEGGASREAGPWMLEASLSEAGAGIPFCEDVTARVSVYMSQFEGQMPPSELHGGAAVVGGIGEIPNGMNGHISQDYTASQHQSFVNLMTLVQYDENLDPMPYLAESWEVSDDNTEITFHIRRDVYWHDGELTDAYDVAYTFERAIDPETAFPNAAFWTHYDQGPDGVEVVDSFTVKFRMQPHADFIDPWRATTILPEHLLGDVPATMLRQHPYGTVCPVGNGPFIFVEHRQDASWTFQANPAFPDGLGGRPYLDRYIYRSITEQTTLLTELLTERLHVYLGPTPDQAQAVIDSDAANLMRYASRQYTFVGWNARRVQLADKRVRQALTRGTNRQEIVDALQQGYGTVANGSVPPFHWAHDPSVGREAMAYDQDAARVLLDAAGWVDRDGDGVRENGDGDRLSISIKYNDGNGIRQGIAEIMQAQLAEIGVEVAPTVVEWGTLLSQISDPTFRDFDGVVMGWVVEYKLDDTDLLHSRNFSGTYAFSGTLRPDIDSLLDQLPLVVDRTDAKPLWKQYQELLVDEQPYTFFYFPDRLDGVSKRLRGVEMDSRGEWLNIKDWWVPADQR